MTVDCLTVGPAVGVALKLDIDQLYDADVVMDMLGFVPVGPAGYVVLEIGFDGVGIDVITGMVGFVPVGPIG